MKKWATMILAFAAFAFPSAEPIEAVPQEELAKFCWNHHTENKHQFPNEDGSPKYIGNQHGSWWLGGCDDPTGSSDNHERAGAA